MSANTPTANATRLSAAPAASNKKNNTSAAESDCARVIRDTINHLNNAINLLKSHRNKSHSASSASSGELIDTTTSASPASYRNARFGTARSPSSGKPIYGGKKTTKKTKKSPVKKTTKRKTKRSPAKKTTKRK